MSIDSVVVSEDRPLDLNRIEQCGCLPAGYVFRARLILMLAEGASFSPIKQRLGTTAPTISRWKQRFLASGMDGLDTNHPGQSASVLTPKLRAEAEQKDQNSDKNGRPGAGSKRRRRAAAQPKPKTQHNSTDPASR